MKIEQIYTGCLAEAAYYIESDGEIAIIDPLRDPAPYLEKAEQEGGVIKYIFETHFHADFVSGHVDLAKESGATIVYGPTANAGFEYHEAKDGEVLKLGKVRIKVLHTPGHTPESSTYLLIDEQGKNHAIFSGDTLFIGDVGRPDLAVKSDLSREDLAGMLYNSLRTQIMPLEDDVLVYPAHGAGSACGKNMSSETWDTLGHQKEVNYALRSDMTKDEFIKEVTTGILPPPDYFPKNAMLNKTGADLDFHKVLEVGKVPLNADVFESIAEHEGAMVLDTRCPDDFAESHIPNSVFIGLDGDFAPWVGTLITDIKQPIVFISEPGMEGEVVTRLSRVGYDNTLGYLEGGMDAWKKAGKHTESIHSISTEEFEARHREEGKQILDVRKPSEFEAEHVENAINLPLHFINDRFAEIDKHQDYFVHCQGGYRSMIFASILKARGYHNLIDVKNGMDAILETNVPVTKYVCPSTLQEN